LLCRCTTTCLSHSASPFFVLGIFWDRVSWTTCQSWLWTAILLISASLVARITDVSHQCPAALTILEMGSHELFDQAGLRPLSFWSQPPKQLGLLEWATGAQLWAPVLC
jgi:hypothetical protein